MSDPTPETLSLTSQTHELAVGARPLGRRVRAAFGTLLLWGLRMLPIVLVLTAARSTLADQYHVPTSSMWPTIEPGDRIFVSKVAYGVRMPFTDWFLLEQDPPQPGEVVVFADPRGGGIPLVKRVVAIAGQTVRLHGGTLFIDGKAQSLARRYDGRALEYLDGRSHEAGTRDYEDYGPATVPSKHVFVLGDNRAVSLDSRMFGAVPLGLVKGRVLGTVYRYGGQTLDASRILHPID